MVTNPVTADLARYLRRLHRFPILEAEEEARLARRWREHSDREAAHKLLTSHLRVAVTVARSHRGYGLPFPELVSDAWRRLANASTTTSTTQ